MITRHPTVRQNREWVTIEPLSRANMLACMQIESPGYEWPDEPDPALSRLLDISYKNGKDGPTGLTYGEWLHIVEKEGDAVQVHGTAAEWFPRLQAMRLLPEHHRYSEAHPDVVAQDAARAAYIAEGRARR